MSKLTMDETEREHVPESKPKVQLSEIDTRMMYQYPKGTFRFPLIEDPPRRRDKNHERTHVEKNPQNQEKIKEPTRVRRSQREPQVQAIVKEERFNKQRESREVYPNKSESRKVEPINKQPFRATEIASPVFGFDRPEKKKLEYELNDSFFIPKDGEEELRNDNQEELFEEIVIDVKEDHVRESEIPSPIFGFGLPEKKELEYELNNSFLITKNEEKELELNFEENLEGPMSEETDFEEFEESNTFEEPEEILFDVKEDHVSNENVEINQSELIEKLFPENAPPQIAHEQNKQHLIEGIKEYKDPEKTLGDVEDDRMSNEIEETHQSEMTEKPILESEPSQKANENHKQRSHLPFNVLMLKKDKEKWQQRSLNSPTNSHTNREMPKPTQMAMAETASTIQENSSVETEYNFPAFRLLQPPIIKSENIQWLEEQKELLDETLKNFNVNAHVVHVSQGPSVTRFEVQPDPGVKVSKITNLSDDIKLSMAAKDIRIEAPIPGKRSIGIEIPNHESRPVQISEIIGSKAFLQNESPLTAVLGLDISGGPIVTDLRRMPHGLIAGATGSGKSVCINSILVSLLYKAKPDELKLLLIDPKMVELAPYNHIPHLVSPVITDVKAATASLKWAVDEMERRYELFSHASVRDIGRFNELATEHGRYSDKLPYIVVVIDELADLMMMAPADVEESICRIAQKARACGIHLIIATQRPSVDVITGLIKANVPTRIAFSVSSQVDSRTIIDISGAEKLLGRGDMLFLGSGSSKPVRLQGTFVSDQEIDRVVEFVRTQGKPNYMFEQEELLKRAQVQEDEDELFLESCDFVVNQGSASTSLLQRQFRIGYNRAARLILMMEQQGIISEAKGSKPRDVLINERELQALKDSLE
ncbi:DNA translocase FtsK [Lederbergia citrisecunda]|nr:DNA translocase FtsK [Lederbergia citrisecunda]